MIIVLCSLSSVFYEQGLGLRLNDGPGTHGHGPISQSWAHGFSFPSADPRFLMGIFVELLTALKQQELGELLLRYEPFDLWFLSQSIRLDYFRIIL